MVKGEEKSNKKLLQSFLFFMQSNKLHSKSTLIFQKSYFLIEIQEKSIKSYSTFNR